MGGVTYDEYFCCVERGFVTKGDSIEELVANLRERDTRLAAWEAVPRERREAIEAYLFGRLGLSSTGVVQLAGAYRDHAGGALLHFQQADLHGSRLVWSVLVDPDELSARVLYHAQEGHASGRPEPIPPTPAGR